jgi:hypothetical protein
LSSEKQIDIIIFLPVSADVLFSEVREEEEIFMVTTVTAFQCGSIT